MKIAIIIIWLIVCGLFISLWVRPYEVEEERPRVAAALKETNLREQTKDAEPSRGSSKALNSASKADAPANPIESGQQPSATLIPLDLEIQKTLGGTIDVNNLMDAMILLAQKPVSEKVDLDYWDNTVHAFPISTGNPGEKAYFEIGIEPYERDGKQLRSIELRLEMEPPIKPFFLAGVARHEMSLHLVVMQDEDGNANQIQIQTDLPLDLVACRDLGIDAMKGAYSTGMTYSQMLDGSAPFARITGTVDGHIAQPKNFPHSDLVGGNLYLDASKVSRLNELLKNLRKKMDKK